MKKFVTFKDLKTGDLFTCYNPFEKDNNFVKTYIDNDKDEDEIHFLKFDNINQYDIMQNIIFCIKNDIKNTTLFVFFMSKIVKVKYMKAALWVAPAVLMSLEQ